VVAVVAVAALVDDSAAAFADFDDFVADVVAVLDDGLLDDDPSPSSDPVVGAADDVRGVVGVAGRVAVGSEERDALLLVGASVDSTTGPATGVGASSCTVVPPPAAAPVVAGRFRAPPAAGSPVA
jgi:hypothetical protein